MLKKLKFFIYTFLYKKKYLYLQNKNGISLKELIHEKKKKIFLINLKAYYFLSSIMTEDEKKTFLFVTNNDEIENIIKQKSYSFLKIKDLKNNNFLNEKIHFDYKKIKKIICNEVPYQSISYIEYIDISFSEHLLKLYPNHYVFFIDDSFFLNAQKLFLKFKIKIKFFTFIKVKIYNLQRIFFSLIMNYYNKFVFNKKKYDFAIILNAHNNSPILNAFKSIEIESKKLKKNPLIITGSIKFFIKNFLFKNVVFIKKEFIFMDSIIEADTKIKLKKYFNVLFKNNNSLFSRFYNRVKEKEIIKNYLLENQTHIPKNIIFLPHIGQIQDAFFDLQRSHNFILSSAPLMTISPSCASTVDWEFLDIIGSYGQIATESFILNEVPISKIINIGNMSYDLINPKKKYNPKKRIILIATSSYCKNEIEWIEKIIESSINIKNVQVVLSLHPSFKKDMYAHLEKKYARKIFKINDQKDSEFFLKQCDLCFTDFSSIGALSIFMKKKLIVVNLNNESYPSNNFDQMKVALLINKLHQITPKIIDSYLEKKFDFFCSKENYEKFINNYNFYNDGKASFRFLNYILNQK